MGDGAFQEKSAKKMREIIDGGAATILVSHSLAQIRELCNKVLWLHKGRLVEFGETKTVCAKYERFLVGEWKIENMRGMKINGYRQSENQNRRHTGRKDYL